MRARPHVMLQGEAAAALELWRTVFDDLIAQPISDDQALWQVELGGLEFTLFDSPAVHGFGPTPAISFFLDVDTSDEVDHIAEALAEDGEVLMPPDAYDFADRYAWVADPFGVTWQIAWNAA